MQTQKPNLDVSPEDHRLIKDIAARAKRHHLQRAPAEPFDRVSLEMDLCATHNTNPLRLGDLRWASDSDFLHDIYGIQRHIDRRTGQLTDHFLPRFTARPE